MNRATRDKFVSPTDQIDITNGNGCWESPPPVVEKLNTDFGPFDIDLTADPARHLFKVWLGPGSPYHEDALTADWALYGRNGFSNPMYGRFAAKMIERARFMAAQRGFTSTLLLPMRANKVFRNHILAGASDLLFCDKRIVFYENGVPRINPKTGRGDTALFDSIIVRFRPGNWTAPAIGIWEVPPHGFVQMSQTPDASAA